MKSFLLYPLFVLCFNNNFIHSAQRSDQSTESMNGTVNQNGVTKSLGEVFTGSSTIDRQLEDNNQADGKTSEIKVSHEPSNGGFVVISIDDSNDEENGKAEDEVDANSNRESQEDESKSSEEQVELGIFQGNYSLYGILSTIKAIPNYLLRLIGY